MAWLQPRMPRSTEASDRSNTVADRRLLAASIQKSARICYQSSPGAYSQSILYSQRFLFETSVQGYRGFVIVVFISFVNSVIFGISPQLQIEECISMRKNF
ncbi:unnamed protein product [Onchocerca flexuosa]|uniref:Uncharacterized protein n=1 Tax=Onchocerca flexuosa TaxID=387005 RepID=A0A183HV09_9BILA|nr:unnamed protein product [Onchocerca flexuosa]